MIRPIAAFSARRLALIVCLLALGCSPAVAEDDAGSAALRFRRIYVPADRAQQWPTGSERYVPIDSQEFERLLDVAQSSGRAPRGGSVQLIRAVYEARCVGEQFLTGAARLEISHTSEGSALLSFEPCNLAISDANWRRDGPARQAPADRASLGIGPNGRAALLVDAPGQLQLQWSLRGERTALDTSFHLQLPECPESALVVDLPKSAVPLCDVGLIAQVDGAHAGWQRWRIELGGHSRAALRIVSTAAAVERSRLTVLRQSLTYEFSPRGVDLSALLRLDAENEPLRRLTVHLDPTVQLVAARFGDREIPWTVTADSRDGSSLVNLELPEPLLGVGRVVRLSAMAPLTRGRMWRLPKLQPEGMFWQEGTVSLLVPAPLSLERIATDGCRQSKTASLAAPLSGESIELQNYRPDAHVDVVLGWPRERIHLDSGMLLELGPGKIVSTTVAQLNLSQGEHFTVGCELAPHWLVDGVECSGSDNTVDWNVDSVNARSRQLTIRFGRALSPKRPVRLLITGHRLSEVGEKLDFAALQMLNFRTVVPGRRLIALRAADTQTLKVAGADELTRIDAQDLTASDRQLFMEAPSGLIFEADEKLSGLSVSIDNRGPSYAAQIQVEAIAQGSSLAETCTIRCVPDGSRVDRLIVQFRQSQKQPWQWNVSGRSAGSLSARLLPKAAGPPDRRQAPELEQWEISFRSPRTAPFEIRAACTVPLVPDLALPLPSLRDATSQRGTVTIRSQGETGIAIKSPRLKAIPAETAVAEHYQITRAVYRYEPGRDPALGERVLTVSPAPAAQESSGAWAWNCNLDSRYALASAEVHTATYRIQTAGREHVRCALPEGAKLLGVWLDDRALPQIDLQAGSVTVDLPPGRAFSTLTVSFKTDGELPNLVRSVRPPMPKIDVPVMSTHWTVWVPPGFDMLDTDLRCENQEQATLTWNQRLFGPLGRGMRETRFNPFSAPDWLQLAGKDPAQEISRSALIETVEKLGTRGANRKRVGGGHLTWRQLLSPEGEREEPARLPLWIDATGLERIDLNPDSRVSVPRSATAFERGIAILQQSNLTLLAHPAAIVLTSAPAAALYRCGSASADGGATCQVPAGSLSDEIEQAVRSHESNRFLDPDQWMSSTERGHLPWTVPETVTQGLADVRGWNAYLLDVSKLSAGQGVRIVRSAAVRSLGWSVFILVVALGLWKPAAGRPWWLLATALLGLAALYLPVAYVPLVSPAFLGALATVALFRQRDAAPPKVPVSAPQSSLIRAALPRTVSALLLLGAGILACVSAWADDVSPPARAAPADETPAAPRAAGDAAHDPAAGKPAPEPANAPRPAVRDRTVQDAIYKVFVPINADEKQSGDRLFIPERMYDELYRRDASVREQPTGWLLERGAYQATLSRDPLQRKNAISEIKAEFIVRVFQKNSRVILPLGPGADALIPGGMKLDGGAILPRIDRDQKELSFRVDEPGVHRFELAIQPPLQSFTGAAGVDLAIPKLPLTVVELSVPNDATEVNFPLAAGSVDASRSGTLVAQLGPSGMLSMRWPQTAGARGPQTNVDVDELLWVKVQPGSMLAQARFKFRVLEGQVSHLRLSVDPRLRLFPSTDSNSPIAAIRTLPGDSEMLELEFAEPVSDQVVVDLSFLLSGTSGIGNLSVPLLEAVDVAAARRWLAISVDPGLKYQEPAGNELKSVSVADFAAAWGPGEIKPQMAFSIPRGEPKWVLATQPREPQTTVEQILALGVGPRSLAVKFDAALTTTSGYNFQFRVQAPPQMEVEGVSVLEDEVQRSARWSRGEDGLITVFLTGPVSGRQVLSLRGRIKTAGRTTVPIPKFSVLGAVLKRNQLHVLRQPEVLVELHDAKGMSEIDVPAPDVSQGEFGTSWAAYLAKGPFSGTLAIYPNSPRVEDVDVTSLEFENGAWTAVVDCRIKVSGGFLDLLKFDIPSQWSEPFQLDRPASWEVRKVGDENRRQLVVRPKSPINDQYRIKIRGRLPLSVGDRPRVPDVRLQGLAVASRFVVLPAQLELQQVFWETSGLRKSQLPAEFRKLPISPESFDAYQVLGDRFQATLKSLERTAVSPHVRLADVSIAWQSDGRLRGVAVFDLEPAGAPNCSLQLPDGQRLLHVSVDGLSVLATPRGTGHWRITLGPQQLPQRIEIVFSGELPGALAGAPTRLEAPSLANLRVDRTLWTIYAPPQETVGPRADDLARVSRSQFDLFRLQSTVAMLDLPSDIAADQAPEEIARWYRRWKRRFMAARSTLKWHLSSDTATANATDESQTRKFDDQQKAAAKRLGVPETSGGRSNAAVLESPAELLLVTRTVGEPALYVSRDTSAAIAVQYRRAATVSEAFLTILRGLALVVACCALVLFSRRYLRNSKQTLVLAVGLIWWLWLSPSFVGLLILVVAAWAILASRWTRSALPPAASVAVR